MFSELWLMNQIYSVYIVIVCGKSETHFDKKRHFCLMIILDNIVVTDDFLNARFCCNLALCKGEY